MITQSANKFLQRCREYRQLRDTGNQLQQYLDLRDGLADVERRLAGPFGTSVTLRKEQVGEPPAMPHAAVLRRQAAEAVSKFRARRDALLDDNQFPLREFRRRAEDVGRQAERALADLWDGYLEKVAPQVAEELLLLLEQDPKRLARVNTVRRLVRELYAERGQPPRDSAQFAECMRRVEQLKTEWSALLGSLGGDGKPIPESVRTFMQRAASGGAPLEMATSEVTTWIARAGLMSAFVVRTMSSSSLPLRRN